MVEIEADLTLDCSGQATFLANQKVTGPKYLGSYDKQIAVFAHGKAVFNALEGDVIDKKFIVAHIGYESVDIRFVGFPDAPARRIGVIPRR